MPRKLRVEYAGAIYHVMSRGDRREDIYLDDVDRQDYLKTLAEAGQKTGFQVHAYCLMRNHFHLVIVQAIPPARFQYSPPMPWLPNHMIATCTPVATQSRPVPCLLGTGCFNRALFARYIVFVGRPAERAAIIPQIQSRYYFAPHKGSVIWR